MSSCGPCLVLLLLCLSLHACSAGRLLAGVHKRPLEKTSQLFIKDEEKLNVERTSVASPSSSSSPRRENPPRPEAVEPRDVGQRKEKGKLFPSTVENNESVVSSSSSSVSWRVPNENAELKQQPGLDSDYSSPKTHPPSHNK